MRRRLVEGESHLSFFFRLGQSRSRLSSLRSTHRAGNLLHILGRLPAGRSLVTMDDMNRGQIKNGKNSRPRSDVTEYKSKWKTEQVIESERGGYPATRLRIAGVYTDTCDSVPLSHQFRRIFENAWVLFRVTLWSEMSSFFVSPGHRYRRARFRPGEFRSVAVRAGVRFR